MSSRSIAVVGGGIAGVGAAAMLARAGYREVTVFERAERVGGVWQHNTYPGAACDVPSHLYEYSFAPNPRWSRRYAPQPEIQEYIEDVARSHGVLNRIRTGTEVHSARWRHDVDIAGRRVAVIGTGCSAIQIVPAIRPEVAHVDVYQRSPGWTIPKMDFAYKERTKRLFERFPILKKLDRAAVFWFGEVAALGLTGKRWLLPPFRALARWNINRAIEDPELRAKVTPRDELGCKRIMLTDDWYPALTEPNVGLVTEPIERIVPGGVRTADGAERPADVLVLATGFATHAFVAPLEITGEGGRTLAEEWGENPRAYLGASVPGFPNMFLLYGPNTNGGTGSVIYTIEAAIEHVISALRELDRADARRIEVRREAAETFDRELRDKLADTVWHSGCKNWYVDEHGNDPNQWPWRYSTYRRRTAELEPDAYELTSA